MKKFMIPIMIGMVFSSILLSGDARAAKDKDDEEEARIAMRKKVEEKKEQFNGSQWSITVNPQQQGAKGALSDSDVLTFQNGQFSSKNFSKLGFKPTNYTLTVPEDEASPTVWETMQTSEEGDVAFWRGEWKDKDVNGVINYAVKDKKNEEYFFTTAAFTKIPPTSKEEVDAETTDKNEIVMEQETESQSILLDSNGSKIPSSKKKKSWFAS